jgi:hypothetical protein
LTIASAWSSKVEEVAAVSKLQKQFSQSTLKMNLLSLSKQTWLINGRKWKIELSSFKWRIGMMCRPRASFIFDLIKCYNKICVWLFFFFFFFLFFLIPIYKFFKNMDPKIFDHTYSLALKHGCFVPKHLFIRKGWIGH